MKSVISTQILPLLRGALLLPIVFFSACATMETAPEASLPGAVVKTGQLSYNRPDASSIVGEFQMVTGPVFRIDFYKGAGAPLISVVREGANAKVSGALAGPGWSGPAVKTPEEAQAWVYLANAFQAYGTLPEEPMRPLIKIKRGEAAGEATIVEFPLTHEEFRFYFD